MQRLDLGLDYHYLLGRRLGVGASYRFAFLRDEQPRPLNDSHVSLSAPNQQVFLSNEHDRARTRTW
jgi:hypothetical protein